MLYIGVDIGGMSVKAGLVDEKGSIIVKDTAVTRAQAPAEEIVADIAALVRKVADEGGVALSALGGIGVGSPGSVDDEAGVIRYSCNINFVRTPFVELLGGMLSVRNVKISNDANCAALGETDCSRATSPRGRKAATSSSRRAARSAAAASAAVLKRMPPQRRSCARPQGLANVTPKASSPNSRKREALTEERRLWLRKPVIKWRNG